MLMVSLLSSDSSSSHLHVSSLRGDVDAYVGESGTAELSSLEGVTRNTVRLEGGFLSEIA